MFNDTELIEQELEENIPELINKERIPKATSYVIIRRCINCGTNNSFSKISCSYCNLLFTDEISYDEWIKINTRQLKKKEDKDGD